MNYTLLEINLQRVGNGPTTIDLTNVADEAVAGRSVRIKRTRNQPGKGLLDF